MRIAIAAGAVDADGVTFVTEAERLGADSVWTAEAWGYDAVTILAGVLAVIELLSPKRPPML